MQARYQTAPQPDLFALNRPFFPKGQYRKMGKDGSCPIARSRKILLIVLPLFSGRKANEETGKKVEQRNCLVGLQTILAPA